MNSSSSELSTQLESPGREASTSSPAFRDNLTSHHSQVRSSIDRMSLHSSSAFAAGISISQNSVHKLDGLPLKCLQAHASRNFLTMSILISSNLKKDCPFQCRGIKELTLFAGMLQNTGIWSSNLQFCAQSASLIC